MALIQIKKQKGLKGEKMKILVVSDTHGQLQKVKYIYENLKKKHTIDMIIHCGDYLEDALQMKRELGVPCYGVSGNCDRTTSDLDYTKVETDYGNILVSHGDLDKVDFGYQNLYYRAIEANCQIALFGHTHRTFYKKLEDMLIINPGSLTHPRDGSGGTCVLLNMREDNVDCIWIDYETMMREFHAMPDADKESATDSEFPSPGESTVKGAKKVQGGFLRSLINYSDRF